jgi:2-oxoisovalerate dehydrogenase E1 component
MAVQEYAYVPFGSAVIRRTGHHVTMVSWGNCMALAEEAAEVVDREGISVELVDLRSLVPCDWATIESSIAKTGRMVVVCEDNRTCGFGQAVVCEMTERPERFQFFISPPQLVARLDTHIGFNPVLEYAVLPDVVRIVDRIRLVMD